MSTHVTHSTTVVTLVRDGDEFQAVIAPAPRFALGIHELRLLWNQRPFITRIFQQGAFDDLMASVRSLRDDLISHGWRETQPHTATSLV
jgi:hypothetical protein